MIACSAPGIVRLVMLDRHGRQSRDRARNRSRERDRRVLVHASDPARVGDVYIVPGVSYLATYTVPGTVVLPQVGTSSSGRKAP